MTSWSEGIARMVWPAYSPNLNSIENLWDALGRNLSSRFPLPATLIELETAVQEEWLLLNSTVVDHLIEMEDSRFRQHVLIYKMMEVYPYCKALEFKGETKEINRRFVYAMRTIGQGQAAMTTFCGVMDFPPPVAEKSYNNIINKLQLCSKEVAEASMQSAALEEVTDKFFRYNN
ncbi:transposable element Tc3 transposase [Trichonephila clavipes]|nr:transposable element Tc3 transposase [Trichonephila clavipes]